MIYERKVQYLRQISERLPDNWFFPRIPCYVTYLIFPIASILVSQQIILY